MPRLILLLDDDDELVRQDAATALGNIGDKRAVEPLIRVLRSGREKHYIRLAAAVALGNIGSAKACAALLRILDGGGYQVSDRRRQYLKKTNKPPKLAQILIDQEQKLLRDLGNAAGQALAKIAADEVADALIALYRRSSDWVEHYTFLALANLRSEYATRALCQAVEEGQVWAAPLLEERCSERGLTIFSQGRTAALKDLRLDPANSKIE